MRHNFGRLRSPLSGRRLEVLEFVCFFRGISFCQNGGAADAGRFAPGEEPRRIPTENPLRAKGRNRNGHERIPTLDLPVAVRPSPSGPSGGISIYYYK
jgi:hypothetical protein